MKFLLIALLAAATIFLLGGGWSWCGEHVEWMNGALWLAR